MKYYKFARDLILNSTTGYCIHFKADRPQHVPEILEPEVIGAGGVYMENYSDSDYEVMIDQEIVKDALVKKKAQLDAQDRVKKQNDEIEKQAQELVNRQKSQGQVDKPKFGDTVVADVKKAEAAKKPAAAKSVAKKEPNSKTSAERRASR